jgi:probable phosphoglycerate mutase
MKHCLTFLRHGESEGNQGEILQGQINSPLSEKGRQQAHLVAERWLQSGVCFDAVISSPLLRARQTAEIIAETLGYSGAIETDPVWLERSFGALEGKTLLELRQIQPPVEYWLAFEPIGGSGESQLDLYLRAAQGLQGLIRRQPGRYLVVSHGALLGKLSFAVMGITPQGHTNNLWFLLGNCAYLNVAYDSEKKTVLALRHQQSGRVGLAERNLRWPRG